MSNIGKLTAFYRLLQEEPAIVIPKVQRDYVYGRTDDSRISSLLNEMLDTMFAALRNEQPAVFDFVYSGPFVKQNDEHGGLVPLDGQQRLTTMFLLHFYAGIVSSDIPDHEVQLLHKFRYETRQSATDFCHSLLTTIRDTLLKDYAADRLIKERIENTPQFLPAYTTDPTICSMLNVLQEIERHYRMQPVDDLWNRLTRGNYIRFYTLSLEHFGLTDDLYIKMNSRGKKLTPFEIFKSDLEKAVSLIAEDLKDQLARNIDNAWMDVVWSYAAETAPDDKVAKADTGYMQLFHNVFRLELFRRKLENKTNRHASIAEMTANRELITEWMAIFDTIARIHKNEGVGTHWQKYFYFDDDVVGKDDRVRLFWWQKQNRKPIIYLAIDRELSAPELVYFYAIIRLVRNQTDDATTRKCLRVIRNLVTANTRANSARYDMLSGFLADASEIIDNGGTLSSNQSHTFLSMACHEEITKATLFDEEGYNRLLRFENHRILQGSLRLFIDKYGKEGDVLLHKLEHFEQLFDNDSLSNFNRLRINLLYADMDYSQHENWMTKGNRRYLVCRPEDWSDFFIANENRRNQEAILDVVDRIETLADEKTVAQRFSIEQWQYYMATYPSACRADTAYGMYAWDDLANRPLEAVILNSSQHSPNNIEWLMLNHILFHELHNHDLYTLDYHASAPLVLNRCGATLSITQNGWLLSVNSQIVPEDLKQKYRVIPCDNPDEYLIILHSENEPKDYIQVGIQLVHDIEKLIHG